MRAMPYEEDEALLAELYLDETEQPIGQYGRLRKKFLQENRRTEYETLLLKGLLHTHLVFYNKQARSLKAKLVAELAKRYPPPDKVSNRAGWEQHMFILDNRAEKIVLSRFIYQ